MTKSFSAQLKSIGAMNKRDLRKVATGSIQDVLEAAQTPQRGITKGADSFVEGKIPVAESDLINSLTVEGASGADTYVVAIAGMEIGGVMQFEWTAEHAMPMEVGFTAADGTNVPGRHFVGKNAARFPEFVDKRVAEVKR